MFSPEKLSLVGGATFRSAVCYQPTSGLGRLTVVCSYLSLSLGQDSVWSGAGSCQGCLHIASFVILLWLVSGQDVLAETDLQCAQKQDACLFARSSHVSSRGGYLQCWDRGPPGWREWGTLLIKLGSEVAVCLCWETWGLK